MRTPALDWWGAMTAHFSHDELVARAERWLRTTKKCSVVLPELVTDLPVIPDAVGWRSHWSIYVECKASRSDFLADRKKIIHRLPDSAPGHERWYFCNCGVANVNDLPDGWGLAEVRGRIVKVLREPELVELNVQRMQADVTMLVSALRREQRPPPPPSDVLLPDSDGREWWMGVDEYANVRKALAGSGHQWNVEIVRMDLNWMCAAVQSGRLPRPLSQRQLARDWGRTVHFVRRMLAEKRAQGVSEVEWSETRPESKP